MLHVIYNKTVPVLKVNYDPNTNVILDIVQVLQADFLPVGTADRKNVSVVDLVELRRWWRGRSIPASRKGLKDALYALGLSDAEQLVDMAFGLSLSDQYWIAEDGAGLAWQDVNFFTNTFSEDVGQVLVSGHSLPGKINMMSPDNTSDGWLPKKWIILDGQRYLAKGSGSVLGQEPYNELFASRIHCEAGLMSYVPYSIWKEGGKVYSICPNFIDEDTELVPAWYVLKSQPKANEVSLYQHFINVCDSHGLSDGKEFLDYMILTDYLIRNVDRHQTNFGIIRDVNTLKWLRFAPLYDSGTSMWSNLEPQDISVRAGYEAKPFRKKAIEQLSLVDKASYEKLMHVPVERVERLLDETYANSMLNFKEIKELILRTFMAHYQNLRSHPYFND